ncbi:MAG: Na+/H+ antiporter NhaC family protein [Chlamydiota bacterium]
MPGSFGSQKLPLKTPSLMEPSFFSLLPPLAAIAFAIISRKIIPSLFVGLWLGASMLEGYNPLLGFLKIFDTYLIPSLGSEWNATVILYGGAFGGLLALLQKTGGAYALGKYFAQNIGYSPRWAQFQTWCLGILIFFDDYFSSLTVGVTMRPITDKLKIAREKLAFIVDSTAAPICLLVPLSTWVIYIVGLIGLETASYEFSYSPYILYLKTIPLNFYAWVALIGTLFFATTKNSFGPMKHAERRAATTGKVHRDQARLPISHEIEQMSPSPGVKLHISNLVIPLTILIGSFPFIFLYTGGFFSINSGHLMAAVQAAQGPYSVLISAILAGTSALLLGFFQGHFTLDQGMNIYLEGIKGMLRTYLVLLGAWAMAALVKDLGSALYLANAISVAIHPIYIPSLLFIISAFMAFTSGTSYGTFAIVIPLALPLASRFNIPIENIIAPILSGGIFGDHCSPISDTTILSSTGTACDPMDHVITQLPYALTAALAAGVGFMMLSTTSSTFISLMGAVLTFILLATFFSKISGVKNVQP